MARSLAPDARRATIAITAAIAMLLWRTPLAQVLVIVVAAAAGRLLLQGVVSPAVAGTPNVRARPSGAVASLALFVVLLGGLPVLRQFVTSEPLDVFDAFFRSGSLVFGGGHVVLPLLQAEVVPPGWVTGEQFIAGYGAAQAVPGPLFTFSAYLGTVMDGPVGGWSGGLFALVAIFLPSFLLVAGILPFWERLRTIAPLRAAIAGVGAAVVGLLLAALYDPVWTTAIRTPPDLALGLAAFAMLAWWKVPPWLVVLAGSAAGAAITAL